jgi:hypothetical protein
LLGEIPKLFGRGFLLGFLLPAAFFLAYLVYGIGIDPFGMGPARAIPAEAFGRAAAGVAALGLILLVLNRALVRFLEGYGALEYVWLAVWLQIRRFKRTAAPALATQKNLDRSLAAGKNPERPKGFVPRLKGAVANFPDKEKWVLPTRFGNAYRAFESYPLVVYGMDAVVLWPRLMCVVPAPAQEQLRDARALLDFRVNMFWLSVAAAILAASLVPWPGTLVAAAPAFLIAILFWLMLPAGARTWGRALATMFDLYRHPLAKSLGLKVPEKAQDERRMWREVTQMILFRSSLSADRLDEFKPPVEDTGAQPAGSTAED